MSMTTLMILQFIKIFAAYTGITVFLPAVMFRRILKGRRLSEKFLMCYTFGNFYIINIVFALQLMHISNVFTLCLVTALLSVLIGCRVNRISLKALIKKNGEVFRKLLQGTMGVKEAIFRIGRKLTVSGRKTGGIFYREVVCDVLQWILTGAVLLALFWVYGRQLVLTYGYRASDIPVHLNWINQMSRGNLFVSGVYPFGFHCMIYYLHTVFRIDTYMILCLFYLYSYGIPCDVENVVQIEISAVCGNSDLYTGKLLGKTDVFQILFVSSSGIWNDFCDSIGVFSDPVFSDRKRTAENKRNKNYSWQFCTGIFINTGNPFLWNDDSGTLLHRHCDRVLHTFSEQGIFQTDYAYRYHQCVSGSITDGNCICRRHTDAGISWVGS